MFPDNTISATATGGTNPTKAINFYRLATSVSFDDAGTLSAGACADDDDISMAIVEFTAADNTFIGEVRDCVTGTLQDEMETKIYMKYTYDDNDQYACGAAVPGTARTEAIWEGTTAAYNCPGYLALGIAAATAPATGGDHGEIVQVDYQALTTGIARFYGGA